MMVTFFYLILIGYQNQAVAENQPNNDSGLVIWEEIAGLENLLRDTVNQSSQKFRVFTSDPVRGYYVDRMGVYLFVPVRYRSSQVGVPAEGAPIAPPSQEPSSLSDNDLARRVRQWREVLQKEAVNKDADFESVVTALKDQLPQIAEKLSHLPDEENLTLIIEEREPAWSMVGFRLGKEASRKLVTLRVLKKELSKVFSRQTTFSADWMSHVKRSNSKRPVIP